MVSTETDRRLARRTWVPDDSENLVDEIVAGMPLATAAELVGQVESLIDRNSEIHDLECVNLNPATNTMSPRALTALSSGMGTRTSLGYAGAKYEMGLEAIEQVEVIAAELAARVFCASHVEVRVPSGAMANLYTFMATTSPGDAIIVPPAAIGGHVTHHTSGCAGLYHLDIHEAPIDAANYTIDMTALAALAESVRPKLITVGSSLNLTHHDVPAIREIADRNGATVLFDAAHLSGPIAGGAWPNPLAQGAHIMTMSTYKSLAGPPSGLVVTNDEELAKRIDHIAFPGLTANFDAAKTAALAITLADWLHTGAEHASTMLANAERLAAELAVRDVPVHLCGGRATASHAFAIDARRFGGGSAMALHLRRANLLASAIGLPSGPDDGLRVGTNELTRIGMSPEDTPELAGLMADALRGQDPETTAPRVSTFRQRFKSVCFAA